MKADRKNIKKAKGVKKNVVKKQTTPEKQLWHGMNILRSDGHEIYGMHVNKISLSPFYSKRWIAEDGIHTHAYGYNPPMSDEDLQAAEEYLESLLLGYNQPMSEEDLQAAKEHLESLLLGC